MEEERRTSIYLLEATQLVNGEGRTWGWVCLLIRWHLLVLYLALVLKEWQSICDCNGFQEDGLVIFRSLSGRAECLMVSPVHLWRPKPCWCACVEFTCWRPWPRNLHCVSGSRITTIQTPEALYPTKQLNPWKGSEPFIVFLKAQSCLKCLPPLVFQENQVVW